MVAPDLLTAPPDVSGLAIWHEAGDLLALANGAPVATWPNKTGVPGMDATQTGATKPTLQTLVFGSQPGVRFDGTQWLNYTGPALAIMNGAKGYSFVTTIRPKSRDFCNLINFLRGSLVAGRADVQLTNPFTMAPVNYAFFSQTVGDVAVWGTSTGFTRTAGAFACSDGTKLDLVGDNLVGGADFAYAITGIGSIAYKSDGPKQLRFRIARSSAYAKHCVEVVDITRGGVGVAMCFVDFTTTTPIVTVQSQTGGVARLDAVLDQFDGSWIVYCTTPTLIAANDNRIVVVPAIANLNDTAQLYIGAIGVSDIIPPGTNPSSIRFSTVGDSVWSSVGSPVRTAAAFMCTDGTTLDKIEDQNPSATAFFQTALLGLPAGQAPVTFRVARFEAYGAHQVWIVDSIAGGVQRFLCNVDFSGGPVPVVSTVGGFGTVQSVVAQTDGSFIVRCLTNALIGGNAHSLLVVPAGGGPLADVATFYIGAITIGAVEYPAPVFYDGSPGDASWTKTGTSVTTPNAFTCSDGVSLSKIQDTDASGVANLIKQLTVAAAGCPGIMTFRVARSSAYDYHIIRLMDVGGGFDLLWCRIDFTLPVPKFDIPASGSLIAVDDRGDGSYLVTCALKAASPGGTVVCVLYPSGNLNADQASVFIGDLRIYNADRAAGCIGMTVVAPDAFLYGPTNFYSRPVFTGGDTLVVSGSIDLVTGDGFIDLNGTQIARSGRMLCGGPSIVSAFDATNSMGAALGARGSDGVTPFNGLMASMAFWNRAHTRAELAGVAAYFGTKYGIPFQLPPPQNDAYPGAPGRALGAEAPALGTETVIPSDTTELQSVSRALFVGVGGDVAVVMRDGSQVTFVGVVAGSLLPIRVRQVRASGTSASGMVSLR